jgi:hypothetical protein
MAVRIVSDARRTKVRPGYHQIIEGKWYAVQHDIDLQECCECGLVHRVYWKIEKGRIYWSAKVDGRLTKKARLRDGIVLYKRKIAHGKKDRKDSR